MTSFDQFTEEQRDEWRRSEITTSALAMLRDTENIAARGVIGAAETGHEDVQRIAGYRQGIEKAIDLLTRNYEKQTG
jgi:hypothetical protein